MRADPLVSRGASSSSVPPPPSSTGAAETSGGGAAAIDVPPPTTSDDSDIRQTLDHVLTVQAAQGQILVDILDEIRGLRADCEKILIAEQYHITNDISFMKKSTKHFIVNLSAYSIKPINNGPQRPINRMGVSGSSYH